MGYTFAEKALARASGLTHTVAGQVVDARPDIIFSHDNTAAIAKIFRAIGVERVAIPEKMCITTDHAVPAPTARHAQNHAEARAFAEQQGIQNYFAAGRGICHQVLSEEAIILPGQLILGSDSHTPHFGWLGAFGTGVGRTEMAVLWATGELWLRVPETLRVIARGELGRGITAKDFALALIGKFGADGGLYKSVEFSGSALEKLSLESRMVIPNMMAEFGVKNAYLAPDDLVFDYLAERKARKGEMSAQEWKQEIARGALYPDDDAIYDGTIEIDASAIDLTISCPHAVDNTRSLREVQGTRVHQAFIGTCTNGRLEDIAAAAEIVRGKKVAAGTRLVVVPASSQVMLEATRLGYTQTLLEAGAMFGVPGCGPCMGNHMGVLAPGEVCISSANRNFQGRMGTRDAEIYLASPSVVAASALAGYIADPRQVG